ncbi:MucBP domain-containing protein, partial [Floricoccus penangensis]|uniref:MucBP domain-containing protein n=1 Tax=Floricoccus penangensis TaxID=1859475 RepID=UPI001570213F
MKNNHNEQNKIGFRQWKSGKQWLFAGAALLSLGVVTTGAVELPGISAIHVFAATPPVAPPGTPTGDNGTILWGAITTEGGFSKQPQSRNIAFDGKGNLSAEVTRTFGQWAANNITAVGNSPYYQWYVLEPGATTWKAIDAEPVKEKSTIPINTTKEGTYYYQTSVRFGNPIRWAGGNWWSDVAQINVTAPVKANDVTVSLDTDYLWSNKLSLQDNSKVVPKANASATVNPGDYTGNLKWSVSDSSIATIDPDTGVITPVEGKKGTIEVIATVYNDDGTTTSGKATLKVGAGLDNVKVKEGDDATFKLEGIPEGGQVTWFKKDKNGKSTLVQGPSTDNTLVIKNATKAKDDGSEYYARIMFTYQDTDKDGKVTTNTAYTESNIGKLTVFKPYSLTVKYEDELGNEIAPEKFTDDNEAGSSYSESPISIPGYTYESVKAGSSPQKGTFDGNVSITYVYKRDTPPSSSSSSSSTEESTGASTGTSSSTGESTGTSTGTSS